MFGVASPPAPQRAYPVGGVRYSARFAGTLAFGLGVANFVLLLLVPFMFWGAWHVMPLIMLPLAAVGVLGTAYGFAIWLTRIELRPEGLLVSAPSWRLLPASPIQHLQASWRDISAVRRRTECYRAGLPWPRLGVDAYAIETPTARLVLGAYYLPHLEPILIDIANRAGCEVVEDQTLELPLLGAIRGGAVPWPVLAHDSRDRGTRS